MSKREEAAVEYKSAVEDLKKFCKENSDLSVVIDEREYPIKVQFFPDPEQIQMVEDNVDDSGEVGEMVVTVGLSTTVKSTLRFKMPSKVLKKIIRGAERVGATYYHAYRAAADEEDEG